VELELLSMELQEETHGLIARPFYWPKEELEEFQEL
jgi:hypothetical protein